MKCLIQGSSYEAVGHCMSKSVEVESGIQSVLVVKLCTKSCDLGPGMLFQSAQKTLDICGT